MPPCSSTPEYLTGLAQTFSWHPGHGLPVFCQCFLDAIRCKKPCRNFVMKGSRHRGLLPHTLPPPSNPLFLFFFLKGIFQGLPKIRKYPSAGGSCSPALATLAALLWALNEKVHKQEALLALASLMRPRRTGDWGCQRTQGGASPVSLPQLLAASFGCHGRYLTASELGEVAQTTPAPGSHLMAPSTHHFPRLLAPFTAACHSN